MYNQIQITFYYTNGQSESFNIYQPIDAENGSQPAEPFDVKQLLQQPWWILTLPEQTVAVNTANILKVEIKPPVTDLEGQDVLSYADRVTALNRH